MLMTAIGMPSLLGDYEKQVVLHKILHILQSLHLYNVIFMSLVLILSEAKICSSVFCATLLMSCWMWAFCLHMVATNLAFI